LPSFSTITTAPESAQKVGSADADVRVQKFLAQDGTRHRRLLFDDDFVGDIQTPREDFGTS